MDKASEDAPDAPASVNLEAASAARIYDAYLGGTTNWAVDRAFAEQAVKQFPLIKPLARANRRFLGRVVHAALDRGITQFLDLGSGVPTAGNVHEAVAAHERTVGGKVVYVDYEPVAVAHAEHILAQQDVLSWAGIVRADLREPKVVLGDRTTVRLLDFSLPVCVLMVSVLHFVGGETDVAALVGRYRERLAPGSWLGLSHICNDDSEPDGAAQLARLAAQYSTTQNPAFLRTRAEVEPWFDGLAVLSPGIVHLADWRPDDEITAAEKEAGPFMWCGVGEVPGQRSDAAGVHRPQRTGP
ncbi:SAM-dependent methyltransferase [Amycolatopsis sp. H20-H5]|uniref:SAM-dependent methyltransferase n=1 Tax=Amycolatopsis sp. H20-H5 TaxID=3046309 RepID=UPI002DBF95D7|nr:SAM-dependent methyltransferase [Amycolatopsis sp. H20-H5]MEC3976366.1 SAM-dependent methyltransferase [Amycolatopsis sp. H20-H5]